MAEEMEGRALRLLTLASDIVAAHVANNSVSVTDVPQLIHNVHGALAGLSGPVELPPPEPAVPIRSSFTPQFCRIRCTITSREMSKRACGRRSPS